MKMSSELPVELFYQDRSDFSIIGITGVAGSGCSTFANLVCNKELLFRSARKPDDFHVVYPVDYNSEKQRQNHESDVNPSIGSFVNKRKYEICYNYLIKRYQEYDVVKYTQLIWLYILLAARHHRNSHTGKEFSESVYWAIADKFKPSVKYDEGLRESIHYDQEVRNSDIKNLVDNYRDWDKLSLLITDLKIDWIKNEFSPSEERSYKRELSSLFFSNPVFISYAKYFIEGLAKVDYYSSCFFYHRMATQIRSTGNPFESYDEWFVRNDKRCDSLYILIRLLVVLIDGRRENGTHRRILIDSIRNSSEALYLKERYAGFYLVAVHDENSLDHLKVKVIDQYKGKGYKDHIIDLFYKSLQNLNQEESKQDDFEKGLFASPDTNRVIERSELHIQNRWGDPGTEEKDSSKMYMAEQWIRYAALIQHPGLVTPTTDERCMAVAFTAKLNSGCLSRQVGAAITNKDGSVRSIGWNEVPHGQISCSLRTIDGIEGAIPHPECSYSAFELRGVSKYKDGKSFMEKIKEDFGDDLISAPTKLNGLPFSYCFKALHNRYEGEKNQVFTRSLHAEENAIIQMSKYGGEALQDGIIYVTASPCELCSKKLYQIGVRKIVYIDPYPGIARQHIILAGFKQPDLKVFEGAIGSTYFKLYQPFMPYKDEVAILTEDKHRLKPSKDLLKKILKELGEEERQTYTDEEITAIVDKVKERKPKGIESSNCDKD